MILKHCYDITSYSVRIAKTALKNAAKEVEELYKDEITVSKS